MGDFCDGFNDEKYIVLTCRAVVSCSGVADMLYILSSWVKPEMTPWSAPRPPNIISGDCNRKLILYPYILEIITYMCDGHHNVLGKIFLVHK